MNREEKIKLVEEYIRLHKDVNEQFEKAKNIIHIDFFEETWMMCDFALRQVEKQIGATFNDLSWWQENNFDGKASIGKQKMRRINTVEKFIKFIEESNK